VNSQQDDDIDLRNTSDQQTKKNWSDFVDSLNDEPKKIVNNPEKPAEDHSPVVDVEEIAKEETVIEPKIEDRPKSIPLRKEEPTKEEKVEIPSSANKPTSIKITQPEIEEELIKDKKPDPARSGTENQTAAKPYIPEAPKTALWGDKKVNNNPKVLTDSLGQVSQTASIGQPSDLPAETTTTGQPVAKTRISFEDFVRKSKESDFLEQAEEKKSSEQKPKEGSADFLKMDDNKKPFIGNVNIGFIDLSKTTIDKKVLSLIPEKVARQYQLAPVGDDGTSLTLAMIDPEDLEAIEIIKKQTGREIIPKITVQSDLNHILDQYSGVETEVSEAITASESQYKATLPEDEREQKLEKIVSDAPVARIVQSIIKRAVRDQASDIHIEPNENGLNVRFRIDGILQKKVDIPKDIRASIISRVKILSGIKIDESRLPQDGRIQMIIDNRAVDFRVSTMPTAFGEKIVLRILDKSAGVLTLEELGLRGSGFSIVDNGLKKSHGMTLVTGPTGSGKTTTLYAAIDKLSSPTINIVTLEDPIEYQMAGINQSQVNSEIDYTFANGLRSILRQDPDIVMIGEIRDKETAEMAVNAALTGHIVLSTLHTNNASGAGPRMIDMGVEPFLITSSLNTIIGQRLTRKLCKNCTVETKVPESEILEVKKQIQKMPEEAKKKNEAREVKFYKGQGCEECHNSGYKGRIGIFEVLNVNDGIQQLLLDRASANKITETAIQNGMMTMQQDGIDKAIDGLTSLEEVWRVTKE
jgi:type IV pilus assembly protein PilB